RASMRDLRPMRDAPLLSAAALVLLFGVLAWTRIAPLSVGFWNDEAFSATNYIDGGPRAIFFAPYVPNNHALFSLMAWITTKLFGRSEVAYRLPSVLPAIAAVVIVAGMAWRRLDPWTAVAFTALAVGSPVHLELGVQARGYGLA